MHKPVWVSFIRPRELPSFSKGLRYSLGYSLLDMDKVGLYSGLVGNWEAGICGPDEANWKKINTLIKKSKKSIKDLIEIGDLNFGDLITEMARRINVPEDILIRFVISKYTHIGDMKKFHKLREGRIDLSAKNKKNLLELRDKIIKSKFKDPRKILLELQREVIFSNENNLLVANLARKYLKTEKNVLEEININHDKSIMSRWLHYRLKIPSETLYKIENRYPKLTKRIKEEIKNKSSPIHKQWALATKYPEIVGILFRHNEFEERMHNVFLNVLNDIVSNPLVTDNEFNYITEIDMCGKRNGSTVYISCKDTDSRKISLLKKEITNQYSLIKKYFEPDYYVLLCSCPVWNKRYFHDNGIIVIDKAMIEKLKKDPKKIDNYLRNEKSADEIKDIEFEKGADIEKIFNSTRLTKYQLASLINTDGAYVSKVIAENKILTKKMKRKLNLISKMQEIDGIRHLHLSANKKISVKKNSFIFRKIRENLSLTQKDLANKLKIRENDVGNYERGLVTPISLENKIKEYLRSFDDYGKLYKKSENEFEIYKNKWDRLITIKKIIKIKNQPPKGFSLENFAEQTMLKNGWEVFKNVVIANKDISLKKEIDIYAIKNGKDVIIECKSGRMSTKWKNVANQLKNIKDECNLHQIFYLSPTISTFGKSVLSNNGIIGLNKKEFIRLIGDLQ